MSKVASVPVAIQSDQKLSDLSLVATPDSSSKNQRDSELMRQAIAGSERAWKTLAAFANPIIASIGMRHLPHGNMEDLSQIVLLKIFRFGHRFNAEEASLSTWIGNITYRTCIDIVRSGKQEESNRVPFVKGISDERRTVTHDEEWISPPRAALFQETIAQIKDLIQLRPLDVRLMANLMLLGGMSKGQFGECIGVPEGTVSSRMGSLKQYIRDRVVSPF